MPIADSAQYRYSLQNSTVHASSRLSTVQVFITEQFSTRQLQTQYSTGIHYRTVHYTPVGDSVHTTQVFITERKVQSRRNHDRYKIGAKSTGNYYRTEHYKTVGDIKGI